MCQRAIDLQHPRQIRAFRTAWVVHVVRNVPLTLGGDLIEPIDKLRVTATTLDQMIYSVATGAATLGASHPQHIELAGEIAEYDCAVAGHVWITREH
jgi:hypothetical protein